MRITSGENIHISGNVMLCEPDREPTFTIGANTPGEFRAYVTPEYGLRIENFDMTVPPEQRNATVNGRKITAEEFHRKPMRFGQCDVSDVTGWTGAAAVAFVALLAFGAIGLALVAFAFLCGLIVRP